MTIDRTLKAVRRRPLSRWVTLVERSVSDGRETAVYHSLDQGDYISVLALNERREAILVRQYRPAVDRVTLELPGGLLEDGEDPTACAARELFEETGHRPRGDLVALGDLCPDTGRLENRLKAYFAAAARPDPGWRPEPGVEALAVPLPRLGALVASGAFDHALHISILGLAMLAGLLPELLDSGDQGV